MNSPETTSERAVLPRRETEEALLSAVRTRAEQALAPQRIAWSRPSRCADREDLRSRLDLARAEFDRLPSGCPLRGRVIKGRFWRRTARGLSIGLASSWSDLAQGGNGAITPAIAVEFYERERALWERQHGSKPFSAAVAGVFAEPVRASPLPALALLPWDGRQWGFVGGSEIDSDLAGLFYPQTPADCASLVREHLDRAATLPCLLSQVASDLGLPPATLLAADGKNLGAYTLEDESGHRLFYRR